MRVIVTNVAMPPPPHPNRQPSDLHLGPVPPLPLASKSSSSYRRCVIVVATAASLAAWQGWNSE